jgi:hypothetical protein
LKSERWKHRPTERTVFIDEGDQVLQGRLYEARGQSTKLSASDFSKKVAGKDDQRRNERLHFDRRE